MFDFLNKLRSDGDVSPARPSDRLSTWFSDDHRRCDEGWDAVERAVQGGKQEEIASAWHSFTVLLNRHLTIEEGHLFPAFERATGMTGGPTRVMREEHDQMRQLLCGMDAVFESGDRRGFLDGGNTLMALIHQHNAKEEEVLYSACDVMLDWPALRAEFEAGAAPDDRCCGCGAGYRVISPMT